MSKQNTLWLFPGATGVPGASLLLVVTLTAFACAQETQVQTRSLGAAEGLPAPVLLALELRRDAGGARLELRGGFPGNLAAIAVANGACASGDDGVPRLPADSPRTCGSFDAHGCFALPVDLRKLTGSTVSCQGQHAGYTAEGDAVDQTSSVLELTVTEVIASPPPATPPAETAPDLSLLLIDLGPNRRDEVLADLQAGDFASALDAALNSAGDNLQVKLSGKVMVKVEGIDVGGSVTYTARMAREQDDYTVAIGRDFAALVGVKAGDDIGLEGGAGVGADQIYRFATSGEAARGLIGIAVQQALGPAADLLREENLAKLHEARLALQRARAQLQEYRNRAPRLRIEPVEDALAGASRACARAVAAKGAVADGIERVLAWTAAEVQFVREHVDGMELRASLTAKAEITIGSQKFGAFKATLGARVDEKLETVVRTWQGYGQPVQKVEVRSGASRGAALMAGLQRGFLRDAAGKGGAFSNGLEVEFRPSLATRTTRERDQQGRLGEPVERLELKGVWKVGPFLRECTLSADKTALGEGGYVAMQHLLAGDATGGWEPLLSLPFTVTVQDKWCRALRPSTGWNRGVTVKLGLDLSWTDAGRKRAVTTTLPVMVQAMTDPALLEAAATALVQQVIAAQSSQQ